MKFSEGEWVKIIEHRFEGALGYIVAIDHYIENFSVRLVRNVQGDGMKVPISYWFKEHMLVPADVESTGEGLSYLIDLSLDMNDKKWFTHLSEEMLKNVK